MGIFVLEITMAGDESEGVAIAAASTLIRVRVLVTREGEKKINRTETI